MATEKRLVDANVVLAKQFTAGLSDASGNYYGHADVVFVNDIENAPIVDAVEVVRCKDCKNRIYSEFFGCYVCHHGGVNAINPEHFCSYGERRADG